MLANHVNQGFLDSIQFMDTEALLSLAKSLILPRYGRVLNDTQQSVLRGILQGRTLENIAQSIPCNVSYAKELSAEFCKLISSALQQPVSKKNIILVLQNYLECLERESPNPLKSYPGIWIPNLRCRRVWGREELINRVLCCLEDSQEQAIVCLCGSAGYGKTEVACEVARLAIQRDRFTDVVWIKARDTEFFYGQITPQMQNRSLDWEQTCREIAHQLNGCAIDQVRHRLKAQKTLIVLDNAETAKLPEVIPKLHEMLNPSRLLITSRYQIRLPYVTLIDVPALSTIATDQLIRHEADIRKIDILLEANEIQREQIFRVSCGAPLALHFMVGRIVDDGSLEQVLAELDQACGDVEKVYEFCLTTAWQRIIDPAKDILRYIGRAEAGVTWQELSGVLEIDQSTMQRAKRELLRWYLLEKEMDIRHNYRYDLHPWVRRSLRSGLVDRWSPSLSEWRKITRWKYGNSDIEL
jgi:hypothetical protein